MSFFNNFLRVLDKTDEAILEKFQKFSDRSQVNTGITCINLARIMLMLFFVISAAIMIALGTLSDYRRQILIMSLFAFYYVRIEITIKRNQASSANSVFKNFAVHEYSYLRKIFLVVLFVLIPTRPMIAQLLQPVLEPVNNAILGEIKVSTRHQEEAFNIARVCIDVRWIFLLICLYFVSCTPKPPSESRIAHYLRRKAGLKTQNVES